MRRPSVRTSQLARYALAAARAQLAEPTLDPTQVLKVYGPLVAKVEAMLEHRRALVATRTLMLHPVQDQIAKLPVEIRDQLDRKASSNLGLRRLASVDMTSVSTMACGCLILGRG